MEGDLGLGYAGGVGDGSGEVMGGRMTGGRGGGDQNMFFGESWESSTSFPSHLHLDVKSSIFDSQYVAHYNADIMNSPGIISFIYHFYTYIIFFIFFLLSRLSSLFYRRVATADGRRRVRFYGTQGLQYQQSSPQD
jgi:hypothetical protein